MENFTASNLDPDFVDLAEDVAAQWSASMAGHSVLAVGLSGGMDSVVLLHVLMRLRQQLSIQVEAIHVHHGLSEYADAWLLFCQNLCADWGIPLQAAQVQVNAVGEGIEAAARKQRYAVFSGSRANVVVLAHHQDDQVETFFLAALRGGGVRALSAMPTWRTLTAQTQLWRPLLRCTRSEILAYARHYQLSFVDDDSNNDTRFLRNWLRHIGLPEWRTHMPVMNRQIQAAIACLQDELSILNEVSTQDWVDVCSHGFFCVSRWRQFGAARQRQLLRCFAQKHQLGSPRAASITAFTRQLQQTSVKTATWSLPHGQAVYYADCLWPLGEQAHLQWPWLAILPCAVTLPELSHFLKWDGHVLGLPHIHPDWQVRIATSQDTLRLQGGRKSVKRILQERKVPVFLRKIWPVVCEGDECIAIVNVAVAVDKAVTQGVLPVMSTLPRAYHNKIVNCLEL